MLLLPTSIVFVAVLYIFGARWPLMATPAVFPFLGRYSFLAVAAILYAVIYGIFWLLRQFHEILWPGMDDYINDKLSCRAGLERLDRFGLNFSLLAFALFMVTDWRLLPLAAASALSFAFLATRPVVLREVGAVRQARLQPNPDPAATLMPPGVGQRQLADQEFNWVLETTLSQARKFHLTVVVDKGRYRAYAESNPYREGEPLRPNFKQLVTSGLTEEVVQVATGLLAMSQEEGFSTFQELSNLCAFVQSIPYVDDLSSKGRVYYRYPIETLLENQADDNCKSVLLASIAKAMGYEVIMLEAPGHTACAVTGADGIPGRFFDYGGRRYYYCEAAQSGYRLGEMPPQLSRDQFKVYTV